MKVAIVHYWLVTHRGGEKVVESLCRMFPEAVVFTHVVDATAVSPLIARHDIRTTFINSLPFAHRHYQKYLPFMPLALELLDLTGFDLVISSESGPAKGVLTSPGTPHICYCHTPMRYAWDLYHEYRRSAGMLTRLLMGPAMHYLRLWDVAASARVDRFVANSDNVRRRIAKHYRRQADVIPPPVDTKSFEPAEKIEDFYLFVGQLIPYKRPDLAVAACRELGRKLVVIGEGPMEKKLKAMAGPETTFLGRQPQAILADHYAHCRALLFPGEEDFGIVPVEAMASGRPVIAYGRGGALETVQDGVSGLFFREPTLTALTAAMETFEAKEEGFDPQEIQKSVRPFDTGVFEEKMQELIEKTVREHRDNGPSAGV